MRYKVNGSAHMTDPPLVRTSAVVSGWLMADHFFLLK
jgi:hypothetical protein